ncbi:P27 family phage terminase small subunit [Pseudonocardia kujensis]|nr:P27 family phage terminase small subunit [Pseudonocardia kujensis]
MGVLHAPDAPIITAYVTITEKADRLRVKMTNEPEIVRDPRSGHPMENPVFGQWLRAVTKMEQLGGKLGLNPSARAGIHTKNAGVSPPATGTARLFGR